MPSLKGLVRYAECCFFAPAYTGSSPQWILHPRGLPVWLCGFFHIQTLQFHIPSKIGRGRMLPGARNGVRAFFAQFPTQKRYCKRDARPKRLVRGRKSSSVGSHGLCEGRINGRCGKSRGIASQDIRIFDACMGFPHAEKGTGVPTVPIAARKTDIPASQNAFGIFVFYFAVSKGGNT